jgi:adenosine deaminase
MSRDFIDALIHEDIEAMRAVPKTDFHNHSIFGTRIERVEKWAGVVLQRPPSKMNGLDGMMSYAGRTLYPYINSREGFEFTAQSALTDAIEDGVRILEMSFDTRFALFYPDREQGFMTFLDSLQTKYSSKITFRPELGFATGDFFRKEHNSIARKCIERGFFYSIDLYGIDLSGGEYPNEPEAFKPLFREAKARGMKLKVHVGESGGAGLVRRTVEVLEVEEVQHGIGAAGSPEIMNWLSRNKIKLNVCPTSNVMLGNVESLERHPIRKLYDHGVFVTINTDDLTIFGQSVSDEYLNLYRAGVFSAEELDQIREASF